VVVDTSRAVYRVGRGLTPRGALVLLAWLAWTAFMTFVVAMIVTTSGWREGGGGLVLGVLAIGLVSPLGVVAAVRAFDRRPALEITDRGVHVIKPWARWYDRDRRIDWDDVIAVVACTSLGPRGSKHHEIAFIPKHYRGPWLDALLADPPGRPAPDHLLQRMGPCRIRPDVFWTAKIPDILAEVARRRPDLPVQDRRLRSWLPGAR
jgi:hypothetical protein